MWLQIHTLYSATVAATAPWSNYIHRKQQKGVVGITCSCPNIRQIMLVIYPLERDGVHTVNDKRKSMFYGIFVGNLLVTVSDS